MRVQSPVTTVSWDADSDSSHATGSCSPGDSVLDVPRRRPKRRVSRSLFPADVQPSRTADDRHSTAAVVCSAWCPPPLSVDGRTTASTSVLPELLGADGYYRLAAAAAASIAGLYWGRRYEEKPVVDLMLPWHTAAANFSLPTLASTYAPLTTDSRASSVLDGSPWLAVTRQDELKDDKVPTVTPDRSVSASSVDDLPLDLSPVSKRVGVTSSPLTSVIATDNCSV